MSKPRLKLQGVFHKVVDCETVAYSRPFFYEVEEPNDIIRDKELAYHIQNTPEWSLWFGKNAKSLVCIYDEAPAAKANPLLPVCPNCKGPTKKSDFQCNAMASSDECCVCLKCKKHYHLPKVSTEKK